MDLLAMTAALFVLVITTLCGLSQARYGIDNVVLSAGRALVGDTLTASCDIHIDVPDPARPPIMLLYWIRQTPKQQLPHVEISVNRGLNNAFLDTGRYSVRALQLDGMSRMQFQLNITDLRTEDSGKLGCRLIGEPKDQEVEQLEDFAVTVPVQKVQWMLSEPNSAGRVQKYEGVNSIDLHEGDVRQFVCRVNGSYPQPQVKVLLGDEDVTSRFMHKHHLVTGGGVAGLQPVYYEVTMTNDALDVDYSYHEKTLSCLASLAPDDIPSTLNSTLAQMSADLNITLLYKPKFLCNDEIYVKLNEPNYDLVCKVVANPDVRLARVTFIDPDDNNSTVDMLLGGGESGDYKANVTVGETEQETIIVLTISRVYKQHFRKYTFTVQSDLGIVSHDVMLKESFGDVSQAVVGRYLSGMALAIASLLQLCICIYVQRC